MKDPNFESNYSSPETFSYSVDSDPIWAEDPSQLTTDGDLDLLRSYFGRHVGAVCHRVAGKIPITPVYGPRVKIGLSETSSCFVVRSEHHYKKEERRRLSIRKHIFESNTDETLVFSIPEASRSLVIREIQAYLVEHYSPEEPQQLQQQLERLVSETIERGEWTSPQEFINFLYQGLSNLEREHADSIVLEILWPFAEPVLRYRPVTANDRWGKYLGFLDLRLYSEQSPVALALLVPPRAYRHDTKTKVITGEYGPLFGGPAFACCPYTMHDSETSGAHCAQAAAINALIILADRGARLMGGYTLTYLSMSRVPTSAFDGSSKEGCLVKEHPRLPHKSNTFPVRGLTFDELSQLLGSRRCMTTVDDVRLPWPQGSFTENRWRELPSEATQSTAVTIDTGRLARRLISAYINARCPIILYVNSNTWYQNIRPGYKPTNRPNEQTHAVVIVGARYDAKSRRQASVAWDDPPPRAYPSEGMGSGLDISELIVHDPGYSPFLKVNISKCFQAARRYNEFQSLSDYHKLHLLCVAPQRLKTLAYDCVMALSSAAHHDDTVLEYQQWIQYFDMNIAQEKGNDYRIELVHRDDIIQSFFHTSSQPMTPAMDRFLQDEQWGLNYSVLEKSIQQLENSWYWIIAGYCTPQGLSSLWAFDSRKQITNQQQPWDLAVHWSYDGWMTQPSVLPSNTSRPRKTQIAPRTMTPRTDDSQPLKISVMTSCSERPLQNLLDELRRVADVKLVDLYVLRDVDLEDINRWKENSLLIPTIANDSGLDHRSSSLVMTVFENIFTIADWVQSRAGQEAPCISALATYFPNLTSLSQKKFEIQWPEDTTEQTMTRGDIAKTALINTVCLALELHRRNLIESPIIELVAGTTLDECSCNDCIDRDTSNPHISETQRTVKIQHLCWQLSEVCRAVAERTQDMSASSNPIHWSSNWAFAVELEPGSTYVINDTASLEQMMNIAQKKYSSGKDALTNHLGINLDIAHARIVQREAEALRGIIPDDELPQVDFSNLQDYIVHAHLSDNPGMHTCDQVIGRWSPVEKRVAVEYDFLELLTKIANSSRPNELPISRAVALELEGTSRFSWILHSVSKMKYMTELIRNYAAN